MAIIDRRPDGSAVLEQDYMGRIRELDRDEYEERLARLEDRFDDLSSEDGMDDNALSRLGLNVAPTPEPLREQVLHTPIVGIDGDDRLNVEGDAIISGQVTAHHVATTGMLSATDVTVTGYADLFGTTFINNLNVQDTLNFNGTNLIERIERMEQQINMQDDEILRLKETIRRQVEANGQDYSEI